MKIDNIPDLISGNAAAQQKPAPTPEQIKQHQKLVKAAQDFEAVFIGTMLKQMRKSVAGGKPLMGGSQEAKMYQEMMDDATAQQMSRTGSFGLAKMLTKSLEGKQPASAPAAPTAKQEGLHGAE